MHDNEGKQIKYKPKKREKVNYVAYWTAINAKTKKKKKPNKKQQPREVKKEVGSRGCNFKYGGREGVH